MAGSLSSSFWHYGCSAIGMVSLIFLGLAAICALISRILLLTAAFQISVWLGLGVFVPFGPLFFRLSYPEQARNSYLFRVATLVFVLGYFAMGPRLPGSLHGLHDSTLFPWQSKHAIGYGMEQSAAVKELTPAPMPTLGERRAANQAELDRLNGVEQELKLRKRDLLHSDTEGNRLYAIDLASYNEALAKATAERNAITAAK